MSNQRNAPQRAGAARDGGPAVAERPDHVDARITTGLGLFSLGLGMAQLAAPDRVSALIGVSRTEAPRTVQRAAGMREIASGAGLLARPHPSRYFWSRVAGDAMDLALLGLALASPRTRRRRAALVAGAVAAVTVLDVLAARRESAAVRSERYEATRSITIRRSPQEVYEFWRDVERLPRFMAHLRAVQALHDRRSRWTVEAPLIGRLEWTAEITDDRPGELIAWRSVPGGDVDHAGLVRFRPAPREQGTEVTAYLRYAPPGGGAGDVVARFIGAQPAQLAGDNLRRLKQILETGDIVRSDASPWGADRARQRSSGRRSPPAIARSSKGGGEMKATCWMGRNKVEVLEVPDPVILDQRDAIVRITSTAVCGSDLHLYNGYVPSMMRGDVLGHEFMGEVVEVGRDVRNLQPGDRVVVPFPIACGQCNACAAELYASCENSNPNAWMAEGMWGHSPAGIFGYSHLLGGYAGGQAEYARVPFADVGPLKIEDGLSDEQVLPLADIFPTGYMGAEMCDIEPGDVIAVWGAGPVGQFAIASAFLLGAERVIAIDRFPYRLQMAERDAGAETLNYEEVDVTDALKELTGGRGPDACIDAVGLEAHQPGFLGAYDRALQAVRFESDRPNALREAIQSCRSGGTVSVIGVYGGFVDKFPMGAVVNRGLTIRAGQCHLHRYMRPLLDRIQRGDIDPSFVLTHEIPLDDAPLAYDIFKHKQDECMKVVLKP